MMRITSTMKATEGPSGVEGQEEETSNQADHVGLEEGKMEEDEEGKTGAMEEDQVGSGEDHAEDEEGKTDAVDEDHVGPEGDNAEDEEGKTDAAEDHVGPEEEDNADYEEGKTDAVDEDHVRPEEDNADDVEGKTDAGEDHVCPEENNAVEEEGKTDAVEEDHASKKRKASAECEEDSTVASPKKVQKTANAGNDSKVYQFKITLNGSKPAIWRRIQVPASFTFHDLHMAIEDSMGWFGSHLHVFRFPALKVSIGVPSKDAEPCMPVGCMLSEWKEKIANYFSGTTKSCIYVYDFGDDWQHKIRLEKILPVKGGGTYPKCLAGKRACPPEDCGGIVRYQEIVAGMGDPFHPNYKGYKEAIDFYNISEPEKFDPGSVCFDNDMPKGCAIS